MICCVLDEASPPLKRLPSDDHEDGSGKHGLPLPSVRPFNRLNEQAVAAFGISGDVRAVAGSSVSPALIEVGEIDKLLPVGGPDGVPAQNS